MCSCNSYLLRVRANKELGCYLIFVGYETFSKYYRTKFKTQKEDNVDFLKISKWYVVVYHNHCSWL